MNEYDAHNAELLCACIIVLTKNEIILSGGPRTALIVPSGGLHCKNKGKGLMNLAFIALHVTEYLTKYSKYYLDQCKMIFVLQLSTIKMFFYFFLLVFPFTY